MNFNQLNLIQPLQRALTDVGYTSTTAIQAKAIPLVLDHKDVLGCAQTGTGKTAAFAIPILQQLNSDKNKRMNIRALVLTPTRELALQVGESFNAYGKYLNIRSLSIFGGVSQNKQVVSLKKGVEVLVATPGRLLDLIQQGYIDLGALEILVLDEADHMLDMGFIHDVKKILAKIPKERQTLFFSATMPKAIQKFADSILRNPVKITIEPATSAIEIQQSVYFVEKSEKAGLLIHLLEDKSIDRSLVFTRTKHGANKLVKQLTKTGINAAAIHGNKSQSARQKALEAFKSSKVRVLVATDVASRGIDIEELPYVVNYNLPNVPETYVHRIGRTGRAGKAGIAISFCDREERADLKNIQKLIGARVPVKKKNENQLTLN